MNVFPQKNPMQKILAPVICCFIVCFLSACAARQRPMPEPADREAESLMEKIRMDSRNPDSMQAMANLDISVSGRRYPMRLALVLKKPQSLRAESIPFFGTPDFFLTVNDRQMKAFLPNNNLFYMGKPTDRNIEAFFPLKLPVEDLAALLMGAAPAAAKGQQFRMGPMEGDFSRIDIVEEGVKKKTLFIDSANNRIVKTLIYSDYGNPLYSFYYQEFSPVNPGIPMKIHIVLERDNANITIRYEDIAYPVEMNEAVFDLDIPAGIGPTYLD
ncbi:MAG: DUF4292 domain-containing protein [Deltaproteobacteria bacterium]|nr:DUF4292 domain-containing protein [Deltaproteobacteria bacterium]